MQYTVVVDLSPHDEVKFGNLCTRQSFCTVLADSDQEAHLVAAQLACSVHVDCMPTRTEIVKVVM